MSAAVRFFHQLVKSTPEQTIYLTHLRWVSGKQKIKNYFSQFGDVMDDSKTGIHSGFASVTFSRSESAKAVVQRCPHVIDGELTMRGTLVWMARQVVKASPPKHQLMVYDIHWISGREQLQNYFSEFGELSSVTNPLTGMNRGYAFLSFKELETTNQLLSADKKHRLDGSLLSLKRIQ